MRGPVWSVGQSLRLLIFPRPMGVGWGMGALEVAGGLGGWGGVGGCL